jgi:hypothetical protein
LTPSVEPFGLISNFDPIGMLDLGWTLTLTPSVKRAWVSSVSPLFERLHFYYIFTAPTKTTTIISHEPCAINGEFQHFITLWIPLKEGFGGEGRPKDRVKIGWL